MDASDEDEFQPLTSRRSRCARRSSKAHSHINPHKKPKLNTAPRPQHTPRQAPDSSTTPSNFLTTCSPPSEAVDGIVNLFSADQDADKLIVGSSSAFVTPQHARSSQQVANIGSSCCPVCNISLTSVSDTDAGRTAHVNACLDAAAATATTGQAKAASAPASPPTTYATAGQEELGWDGADVDDIQQWLLSIGAGEVYAAFKDADVDLSVVPHLNDHDLQEVGVADVEVRSRILQAAADIMQAVPGHQNPAGHQAQQHELWSSHMRQGEQLLPAAMPDSHEGPWPADWLHSQDCGEEQQWESTDAELLQEQQQQQLPVNWQQEHQQHTLDAQGVWEAHPDEQLWEQPMQAGLLGQVAHGVLQQHGLQPQCSAGLSQEQQQQQQDMRHQEQYPRRNDHPRPLQQVQQANPQQQPRMLAAAAGGDRTTGSIAGRVQPGLQQSSITGFVVHQPPPPQQQQQQHADAKEQWRALFKRPKQSLGAHDPAQQQAGQHRQARINRRGQVVTAAPQPAAAPPLPALPQVPGANLPSWWPAWRRLPSTNIIVDCFGRSCAAVGPNRTWVLTHFHADHYMGLSRSFKQGVIICTPITAALVRLKLRVAPDRLAVLELGQELTVEGTRLQLIDANHCPGAAMVVAHPPGGAPPVLHTGDARLSPEATRNQPVLQALVGKAVLVLDTTYADPAYCFPPQQDVLDWVLRAVKAELFNPRCLFLFGTYTIGKERLFLHVASALQRKVYVAAAKRSIMGCIDLPPQLSALLTTNHLDANIHAVPMRQVTLEAMESLLLRYKGRYTAVVGFKPTGWSHAGNTGRAAGAAAAVAGPSRSSLSIKPNRRRSQRGTVVLYQVPYSEHSSCAELRSFVEWFKPLRIIPSVNNDNGPKLRAMMAAVTASGATTGPMDAFARR